MRSSITWYEQTKCHKAPEHLSSLHLDVLAAKEAWQRKRQTPLFFKQEEREKSHHPNAASARASAQGRVQPKVPAKDVADSANAEILRRKPKEVRNEETEKPRGSQQRKQEKREEAESQQQRPSKDQQLNLCEDGQCERLQDASTIAYKKEVHQ